MSAVSTNDEACDDGRSVGDDRWFANGVLVQLCGLRDEPRLNGSTGEVVGFDRAAPPNGRYRVRLQATGDVCQVQKRNLWLLPNLFATQVGSIGAASSTGAPAAAPPTPQMPTALVPVGQQPTPPNEPPTKEHVMACRDNVEQNMAMLQGLCDLRQSGEEISRDIMTGMYSRLTTSYEVFNALLEQFTKTCDPDEEVFEAAAAMADAFKKCEEHYFRIRSWSEVLLDEVNLTHQIFKSKGVLGAFKDEAAAVVEEISYFATQAIGTEEVVTGPEVVPGPAWGLVSFVHEAVVNWVKEKIADPLKRAWHLLLYGFLMCFIVPLFALRMYYPLNSVVSNLGLVYVVVVCACPPRCAQSRKGKAGLLLLYPVVMVLLPTVFHAYLTGRMDLPRLPEWVPPAPVVAARLRGATVAAARRAAALGRGAVAREEA